MTEEQILGSDVFRFINRSIDAKARELEGWMLSIRDCANHTPKHGIENKIRVRVYLEISREQNEYYDLPFANRELEQIETSLKYCQRLREEIRSLQTQKCVLLNDYDFTHGDNAEQSAVFGVEHVMPDE